ncbi:MAG: hypothetical protein QOE70_1351 [Chthoniobacter sp.]|nr:hypothetical protein [Chthoniobacter sp.]
MKIASSVAELQRENVTLELECIDRMYLNAYVPKLTSENGVAAYFRGFLGHRFASTKSAAGKSEGFVREIMEFIQREEINLVRFQKGMRKDEVMKKHLRKFEREEGVLFVGVAQEKARVPRTIRKHFGEGGSIPWIDYSSAMVNFYYFYCVDEDFGPFFIKFCSYFPYTAKLCLNGHEYIKRQLEKRGIAFEALDNGLRSCAQIAPAQRIADGLSAPKIDAFFRKWLRKLPHPFTSRERAAGYRYELSVLQAEFSLTQVWDRGLQGRCFFEEVIRENIDLGRPEQVQLIFGRKLRRKTVADGRCRTRIIQEGVQPSLHVYYKNTHLKQYHKEGRALRTETTINNTYDFQVGRLLKNLPRLREIGFGANRRVLEVETVSHNPHVGAEVFAQMQKPAEVDGQHASALRFGDPRVQALLSVLLMLCLQPDGVRNRQLRPLLAQCLGVAEQEITPGKMSYDLRRLRLHGIIERIEGTHRYRLTEAGRKTAFLYSRLYLRALRPGLSLLHDPSQAPHPIQQTIRKLQRQIDESYAAKIAA